MRVVLALISVVFIVTAASAQGTVAPSPSINFLCDIAFSKAAESAHLAADSSARSGAAATASPHSDLDSAFLDEAIRMCTDIDEFVTATQMYPDLVDGIDVISFVTARCADPTTGLYDYATCNSLRRALATPTPSPPPTPVPSVTPHPTPALTRRPRTGARPTPRPTVPRVTEVIKPRSQVAKVPSDYQAPVHGATRVHYFDVAGGTPNGLIGSMRRRASAYCHSRLAVACVQTRFGSAASHVQNPFTGSCTITGARLRMNFVAHIPRWTAPRRVPAYMAWWWRRNAARIGWHEAQHVRIAKRYAARLPAMVIGRPCASYGRLVRRWNRSMVRAQNAFDRLDYPRSDRVSERLWREAYERFQVYR